MPINRYQIRNEYSLADPELYKIAGKDDPEALLEGVAMAGLVGVLRQLGDLAQFAAEIFHDLHEEVMSTSARGHSLIVRVQQLEAEFPSVEKTLLLQTRHTTFLYNSGMDWHPNLRMDQNLVTRQDLPRFVLDSYEECRGPPRLFLLDKFDVAGAGASLKRYTDPSFFKEAPSSTNRKSDEQRERRIKKVKKRGPRWRNGDTPVTYPSSHAKLHQLFLEENIETGGTPEGTERRMKLKNRQFYGSLPGQNRDRSYMEKILNAGSQQQKIADENCVDSLALTWPFENGCEYTPDIVETGTISPLKESTQTAQNAPLLLNNMVMMVTSSMDEFRKQKSDEIFAIEAEGVGGCDHVNGANKIPSTTSKIVLCEESYDGQRQSEVGIDGHNSDGFTSEIDNYLDALATPDSEVETDSEGKNPHCSNLKSVMKHSDTSEGKKKLLSNDAQLNDNVVLSEDDSTYFKGQDCSSCSVSVDIFAETTAELDASVISVPSTPSFNPDLVEVPADDHSMTEEIPGDEPEKHADRSTIVRANESSEIRLSEEYVHVDEDGNMQKICLLNEDLGETYIDVLTSTIGDEGDANQSTGDSEVADGAEETHRHCYHGELSVLDTTGGNSSVYPESFPDLTHTHNGSVDLLLEASIRPNSNSSSNEEHSSGPARADMADFVGTGLSLNKSFISDFKHPEIVGPIGLASNKDSCFTSSKELSANRSSASYFTHCSNFQEQISGTMNFGHAPQPEASAKCLSNTPEDLVIKAVIADVKSEKEEPSPSSISEVVDTDRTNIVSIGSPEDEEIRGYSIVTGDLTPVLDFSEAQEHRQELSEETDVALLEHHLAEPLAKHLQNNGGSVVEASSTSESNAPTIKLITPMKELNLNLLSDESSVKPVGAVELSSQSLHYSHQIQTPYNFHGLPSVSQLSPQYKRTDECSSQSIIKPSPNFLGHDTLNGHNRAKVDNSVKPVYPLGFATIGMFPTEPQINLHAPPLPPLPPMQWRLSRLQNSSGAPDRHMLQHTLDLSQPKHGTVLEQSSQDEKYEYEEENLSATNASMSVGSQNGTQLSENGYVVQQGAIALPMLQSTSVAPEGQVLQHTIDFVQPTPTTVLEAPSHDNMKEFRSEDNLSLTIPTSVRCHVGTQDPSNGYGVYSENNMSGVKREDDLLSIPTSTCYPDGNQMYEESYQLCENLRESTSLVEGHDAEAKVDAEVGSNDELLKHISQDNEEVVNSDFQFLLPSHSRLSGDLVSPEAGRTIDGVQINAGSDTKETLQKKPPRPRNPLIDEVIAIDKSKLRKVERIKSSLELKPGGDLLIEQMQLKKVEKVKPLVEGKAGDGESSLEHVKLRKAGERSIPEVEQNPDDTKSPRLQLRKVPKQANPLLGSNSMERDSLLEQIRTKSFNLKPAVMSRPNLQGPRANLKVAAILEKASNIRQAMAGSDEEDDWDSWSEC